MRRMLVLVGAIASLAAAAVVAFRRNPRIGTRFVNERVNPLLVARGLSGRGRSELGTIEHIGRRSGTRRLTPVHPTPIERGFRIMVPVGTRCEWARNVVAAGHCRMELGDEVYELDEPELVLARTMPELALPIRLASSALGFMYLRLHTFAHHPGTLDEPQAARETTGSEAAPEPGIEAEPATAGA